VVPKWQLGFCPSGGCRADLAPLRFVGWSGSLPQKSLSQAAEELQRPRFPAAGALLLTRVMGSRSWAAQRE